MQEGQNPEGQINTKIPCLESGACCDRKWTCKGLGISTLKLYCLHATLPLSQAGFACAWNISWKALYIAGIPIFLRFHYSFSFTATAPHNTLLGASGMNLELATHYLASQPFL